MPDRIPPPDFIPPPLIPSSPSVETPVTTTSDVATTSDVGSTPPAPAGPVDSVSTDAGSATTALSGGAVSNPLDIASTAASPPPKIERPVLTLGARGESVRELQGLLSAHGYDVVGDGVFGSGTEDGLIDFQGDHDLMVDGVAGPQTWNALAKSAPGGPVPRVAGVRAHRKYVVERPSVHDSLTLMQITAVTESGGASYTALNPNDGGAGVSFGRFQFNQKHHSLGKLFKAMYAENPERFVALTYGDSAGNANPKALAEKLVAQLNSTGQAMTGSLTSKLSTPQWRQRFRAIGNEPDFQMVQDRLAVVRYFEPAQEIASRAGLDSERGQALIFDICIQHGIGGAKSIVRKAQRRAPAAFGALAGAPLSDRPELEHDTLVVIAKASADSVRTTLREIVIARREAVLRSDELSDAPYLSD